MTKLHVTKNVENTSIQKLEKRKPFFLVALFFALFGGGLMAMTAFVTSFDGNGKKADDSVLRPSSSG